MTFFNELQKEISTFPIISRAELQNFKQQLAHKLNIVAGSGSLVFKSNDIRPWQLMEYQINEPNLCLALCDNLLEIAEDEKFNIFQTLLKVEDQAQLVFIMQEWALFCGLMLYFEKKLLSAVTEDVQAMGLAI